LSGWFCWRAMAETTENLLVLKYFGHMFNFKDVPGTELKGWLISAVEE